MYYVKESNMYISMYTHVEEEEKQEHYTELMKECRIQYFTGHNATL